MDDPWAAFVAARLDEEHWEAFKFHRDGLRWQTEMLASLFGRSEYDPVIRHVSRYDPARAMREVAAKRAILAEHKPRRVGQSLTWCGRCHQVIRNAREDEDPCGPFDWPCPTVRALAAAWSDHGDYPAVESAVDPGKPARNYELADRLGIGHVLVRDCQLPCDGDCEIAPVHCWNWHRPNHKPDWHDPANCDAGSRLLVKSRKAPSSESQLVAGPFSCLSNGR